MRGTGLRYSRILRFRIEPVALLNRWRHANTRRGELKFPIYCLVMSCLHRPIWLKLLCSGSTSLTTFRSVTLPNHRRANGKTVTPPCHGRGLGETFAHREADTRCTAGERPERRRTSSCAQNIKKSAVADNRYRAVQQRPKPLPPPQPYTHSNGLSAVLRYGCYG